MMRLVFTAHALERMKERGITEEEIHRVLASPLSTSRGSRGEMRAEGVGHGRIVKVVYYERKGIRLIITAWIVGDSDEGRR